LNVQELSAAPGLDPGFHGELFLDEFPQGRRVPGKSGGELPVFSELQMIDDRQEARPDSA